LLAGGGGMVLSALGWRRTLKPAITVVLFLGALVACGLWVQVCRSRACGRNGLAPCCRRGPACWVGRCPPCSLPSADAGGLDVEPALRRLTGPVQLRANLWGMVLGAAVMGAAYLLLP
jgi:hypothetical protein